MWTTLFVTLALALSFSSSSVIPKDYVNVDEYFIHPKDRSHDLLPRIIGGEEVIPHSYPFQAAIYIVKGNDLNFCAGTLISKQWVLTAAHCIDLRPESDQLLVILGIHNLDEINNKTVAFIPSQYVQHEHWDKFTKQNDIGLIQLPEDVTFTENIQPVVLANGVKRYMGVEGTTIGWGNTESDGLSSVLKQVNSTIMSNEDCAKVNPIYKEMIVDSHICLSGAGTVGTCIGDSGGPLLVNGVQVGITSFGSIDCTSGMPSVFTRITDFHDWIVQRAGLNDSSQAS